LKLASSFHYVWNYLGVEESFIKPHQWVLRKLIICFLVLRFENAWSVTSMTIIYVHGVLGHVTGILGSQRYKNDVTKL
jgi:hypothetical protein